MIFVKKKQNTLMEFLGIFEWTTLIGPAIPTKFRILTEKWH